MKKNYLIKYSILILIIIALTSSCTTLYQAVEQEDYQKTEELLANGEDVNQRENKGSFPLYKAVSLDNDAIVRLLIENGADVNMRTNYSSTVLHVVQSKEVAEMLIQAGAKVNVKNNDGKTPLHFARNKDIAQILVENGIDKEATDKYNNTAMHDHAFWDKDKIINYLVSVGANVMAKNKNGNTPLHTYAYATNIFYEEKEYNGKRFSVLYFYRNIEIQDKIPEILVSAGADINAQNDYGSTPLHFAVEYSKIVLTHYYTQGQIYQIAEDMKEQYNDVIVKAILNQGADVNIQDEDGDTPLHLAMKNETSQEVIDMLIAAGGDLDIENEDGDTPRDIANENGIIF